jgi:allantoicase
MKKRLLLLVLLFLTIGFRHPFYLAVMEVEYSSKTKEIGIACKVFPDDMEETLRQFTGKKHDLYNGDKSFNCQSLKNYFGKHFNVLVNGKPRQMQFLGFEIDKEVVWIYFNIPRVSSVKSIAIDTDFMYGYRPEQTNILHLNIDGKKESFRLNAPNTKAALSR